MENDGTLNLLLIHDNVEEANRLVSLMRNASYKVDPQHVAKPDDLAKKIQERNWDIAFIQFHSEAIPVKSVFHQIRRLNKDIPVVLISMDYDTAQLVEGLRMGASDVVPMDQDQHLLQVVSRTLYNLEQRRRLRYWKRRYTEAEERCEHLLKNSRDGIAIVQDGTYVNVNESYANHFGYLEADGMLMLPVIDTIEPGFRQEFLKYLKPLDSDQAWETETLTIKGLKPESSAFEISTEISQIEYQGEPALQFLIDNRYLLGAEGDGRLERPLEAESRGLATIRLQSMLEQITAAIRKAAHTEEDALLFYILIDKYQEIQDDLGLRNTENLIVELARFIDYRTELPHHLGRIKEDAFVMLMENIDVDSAVDFAEILASEIANHMVEQGDRTCQATVSIGISVVSEAAATAEGCIERCMKAITSLREESGQFHYGNGARLYEAVFEPAAPNIADEDIMRFGAKLLERHMLDIAFQPIVPLHGKPSELYEVLMRPVVESMPKNMPDDFIAKVFKTDVGKDIDRWVILESIKTLAQKQKTHPETRMLINISAATICDDQFIPWLKVALKATGIGPQSLIFQFREIDVSRHLNRAISMTQSLHKFHSKTALTHFGLSINPLQVFDKLKFDFVKLDMLVVEKARKDDEGMETMLNLIKNLETEDQCVVVPFIENAAMIPGLWQAGVQYIQGHYIQAPVAEMNYEFSEEA